MGKKFDYHLGREIIVIDFNERVMKKCFAAGHFSSLDRSIRRYNVQIDILYGQPVACKHLNNTCELDGGNAVLRAAVDTIQMTNNHNL